MCGETLFGQFLVEVSVVSESEKIEFEALAFKHLDVRDIADAELREVRLSCNRNSIPETTVSTDNKSKFFFINLNYTDL